MFQRKLQKIQTVLFEPILSKSKLQGCKDIYMNLHLNTFVRGSIRILTTRN